VHRVTAGITTIQYTTSFVAPILAGIAWDATGSSASAYLMVAVAGIVQVISPLGLRLPRPRPAPVAG
jgi:hypothetical protein